jgi:hypothetical protein
LHGGVNVDDYQSAGLNSLRGPTSLHRQAQDEFTAFLPNPVAKKRHQAVIDGQVVT